ncbi:MAG: cytochrome c biogenesis protein CcsA [Anaerolineales bacterium]|jgi:heme exporter protein C
MIREKESAGRLALAGAAALLLVAALGMVFGYAPREAVMGDVQRIFYFHVSSAWVGMLSFVVAAVSGGLYLSRRERYWDMVEISAVEIGIVFGLIAILSGSIWARPVWNTWWTWDPRLVTTSVMELVYAAYLLLRQGLEDPERRARFGAVYSIVGVLTVPITFLSIRFLRSIHPVVIGSGVVGALGGFAMTSKMLETFLVSLLAFTVLYAALLVYRVRLALRGGRLEERRSALFSE